MHWGYACYLPVAILWSALFYCIQGTVDYKETEDEEDEDEDASPKKEAALLSALSRLSEKKNEDRKEGGEADCHDAEHEKPERNKLPGRWYNLISVLGML